MAPLATPSPTNVIVVSKIPEGITEQQIAGGAGRYSDVLQVSYRPADLDGPGWAIIAFATPELAKAAKDRLDGKPLPGCQPPTPALEAALGEGLYGNLRSVNEADSPWKEARTPQGQVYYYHAITRQTTWVKPAPEFPSVPLAPNNQPLQPPPPPQFAGGRPQQLLPPAGASGGVRPIAGINTLAGGLTGLAAQVAASRALPSPPPAQQAQAAIQGIVASQGGGSSVAAAANNSAFNTMDGGASAGPVGANLFVYHIPNSWDDNILRQHFEHFGKIASARVQKDPEGRPRGFGFVSFDSASSAAAAIAGMHGFPVEGKWLKVQLKKGDEQMMDKSQPSLGGTTAPAGITNPVPAPAPKPFDLGPPAAPGSLSALLQNRAAAGPVASASGPY